MNGMRRILAAFVCAAMLVSLAACGASGTSAASATAVQEANGAYDVMAEAPAEDAAEDVLQDGRKIVLNATLSLEALDFDLVCAALEQAAADAGGYASYSSVEGGSDNSRRYASYTFRIPADRYEEFLTAAGDAGNLISRSESAEDITAQYVDTEARISALETQRDSLMEMLEQAQDVETLLAIRTELSDVQYQLESYEAQKRAYDDLVAYSTVDVTVREVVRETSDPESFGARLASKFADGWFDFGNGLMDLAVGVVYLLPWILVLCAVGAGGAALSRRMRRKRKQQVPPELKQADETQK